MGIAPRTEWTRTHFPPKDRNPPFQWPNSPCHFSINSSPSRILNFFQWIGSPRYFRGNVPVLYFNPLANSSLISSPIWRGTLTLTSSRRTKGLSPRGLPSSEEGLSPRKNVFHLGILVGRSFSCSEVESELVLTLGTSPGNLLFLAPVQSSWRRDYGWGE